MSIFNSTVPSPVSGKTPYKLWYGKQEIVDHSHDIGTECFVHIFKQKRRKWDYMSVEGVLVGKTDNKVAILYWYMKMMKSS